MRRSRRVTGALGDYGDFMEHYQLYKDELSLSFFFLFSIQRELLRRSFSTFVTFKTNYRVQQE